MHRRAIFLDLTDDTLATGGKATFGLTLVATLLLMAALAMFLLAPVTAPKLPNPILALALPLVLAFIAFIFEMAAWANWAATYADSSLEGPGYGARFVLAM